MRKLCTLTGLLICWKEKTVKGTNTRELKPDKVKSKARHVLVNTKGDEMNEHAIEGWRSIMFLMSYDQCDCLCNCFFRSGSVPGRHASQETTVLSAEERKAEKETESLLHHGRQEDNPARSLPHGSRAMPACWLGEKPTFATALPCPIKPTHQNSIPETWKGSSGKHKLQRLFPNMQCEPVALGIFPAPLRAGRPRGDSGEDFCSWGESPGQWDHQEPPGTTVRHLTQVPSSPFLQKEQWNLQCNVVSKVWMINGDGVSTHC